ncbi:MAG: cyclase family protein [Actinomycetota bacterium]|nr:cyclase family protein [Actinomycetota bacterium]
MYDKIIDLTAEMYDGAPTMPMDPKLAITRHCNLDNLGYNLERVITSTHQGTHIDAPYHFFYEGQTIDKVDLDRFVVRAIKVDLTHKKPKEAINIEDLKQYESSIDRGLSVLLHTGWDKVFPEKEFFSDFPFVSVELTNWAVEKKIPLLGMDMPTPNRNKWKLVHQTFLKNNILVVEGLANMEQLGNEEFTFFALPLKLKGCGGSPIRAAAVRG